MSTRDDGPGLIVGAYAASPAHARWDPVAEDAFFQGLAELDSVRGLELPWVGRVHPHDDAWLLAHFPRRFDAVLTSIPGTMKRLQASPSYGLASLDEDGRRAAVAEAFAIRDAARRLNDACGRRAVIAVELHSAPVADGGSTEALHASLAELAEADGWDGADIVIEHCDAAVHGRAHEKGFLSVTDELAAIEGLPDEVGMSANWGRSAIELRNGDAVAGQIADIAAGGRLRGLMFSGASGEPTAFGGAWIDAHHPMVAAPGFPQGEPTSLLTPARMAAGVAAAGDLRWAGFKFGWAEPGSDVDSRVAMIAAAADIVTSTIHTEVLHG